MTKREAYLTLFFVLDICYETNREDLLGGTLGVMSPYLCKDGMPVRDDVMLAWFDFCDYDTLTPDNVRQRIADFLGYLEKIDPYYCFPKALDTLKRLTDGELLLANQRVVAFCTQYEDRLMI